MRSSSLLRGKELVARGIVHHARDTLGLALRCAPLQRHRHAENWISMRKVRGAVERVHIPAVVAALVVQSLLFAKHVVAGKLLLDAFANQRFRSAVGRGNQIGVALVFDLDVLLKILHQQRARFARNGRHGREKGFGMRGTGLHFRWVTLGATRSAQTEDCRFQLVDLQSTICNLTFPRARSPLHFRLPPSSAMYMISCLKMNRLGAPSRVSRTMFLS